MAACALLFCDRAGLCSTRHRRSLGRIVAGKTFRIVRDRVVVYPLVRIVAGKAADARVIADKAFAVFKAIGLKSHKGRPVPFITHHRVPGAMTLSAEVGDLFGIEMLEGWRDGLEIFLCSVGHVLP